MKPGAFSISLAALGVAADAACHPDLLDVLDLVCTDEDERFPATS